MGRIVVVGLRPFAGQEETLREMVKKHWSILRAENLVSDRKPIIMEAKDGSFIEVFGWKSKKAIEAAHSNPIVQQRKTMQKSVNTFRREYRRNPASIFRV